MSGIRASGGYRNKARREPDAGLLRAKREADIIPDPPGLESIRGNNKERLRIVAKLIHCLCDGITETRFYLGSVSLGMVLGVSQQTAHNRIKQLESQGIMRRVWKGRPVRKDENGKPIAGGKLVDRASEYVYMGMPRGS